MHGAVLVFDVTDRNSFIKLTDWMFELELHCREQPVKILVANKTDLVERFVHQILSHFLI